MKTGFKALTAVAGAGMFLSATKIINAPNILAVCFFCICAIWISLVAWANA